MNFSTSKNGEGLTLLLMRPDNLEESKMYPSACLGMAIRDNQPVDMDTLVRYLNSCLAKIGRSNG